MLWIVGGVLLSVGFCLLVAGFMAEVYLGVIRKDEELTEKRIKNRRAKRAA